MLFEFPGILSINKSEVLEDLRLNIPNNSQFRCKFTAIDNGNKIPVDIICRKLTYQAGLNGVEVFLNGVENTKHLKYHISIAIHPIAKYIDITGYIGNTNIQKTLKDSTNALDLFKEVCMLFANIK